MQLWHDLEGLRPTAPVCAIAAHSVQTTRPLHLGKSSNPQQIRLSWNFALDLDHRATTAVSSSLTRSCEECYVVTASIRQTPIGCLGSPTDHLLQNGLELECKFSLVPFQFIQVYCEVISLYRCTYRVF